MFSYYNGPGQTSPLTSRTWWWQEDQRHFGVRIGRLANGLDMGQERPRVIKADFCILRVLVHPGVITRILLTGWLEQQTFIPHDSGREEIQDQGTGRFSVRWGLSCSWTVIFLLCLHRGEGARSSLGSLFKGDKSKS